jgi:hypothetical protein
VQPKVLGSLEQAFVPHRFQAEILRGLKRFSVLVCHRRFGKTVLALHRLVGQALASDRPDCRLAYIAPLYKQAKTVAWDLLKRLAAGAGEVRFSETELRADFENGARIRLFGANNPDSLRGMYLDGAVFDEVSQMPLKLFGEIVRPALADRKGFALFIGTPQGRNALYALFQRARTDPTWFSALYRASDTDILDPEELAAAKREMSPEEYAQEFECSFTAAVRGAYFGGLLDQAEREGRIANVPAEPTLPVHTAWDLGMSDSTFIWFFQALRGGEVRVIDACEAQGVGLDHYARLLEAKGYVYGTHIAPHDIMVRELGTGKSRLEMAASLGIRFTVAPNLPVQDGIQAARALLPRCWFDATRCASGLEALRHYRRDFSERGGDFSSRPRHDWTSHAADAFRYFAVGFRPRGEVARSPRAQNDFNPFAWRA